MDSLAFSHVNPEGFYLSNVPVFITAEGLTGTVNKLMNGAATVQYT